MTDMAGVVGAFGQPPTIRLLSGRYFSFEQPTDCRFTVNDVAHALAHLCRFTGHTRRFYSVAEHSVLASRIAPPELRMDVLMHDAAEAFIGDVSSPLKAMLPEYREIEARVAHAVCERFGLSWPMPGAVKRADLAMLQAERMWVIRCREEWACLEGISPGPPPEFWTPQEARRRFLARYRELKGATDG